MIQTYNEQLIELSLIFFFLDFINLRFQFAISIANFIYLLFPKLLNSLLFLQFIDMKTFKYIDTWQSNVCRLHVLQLISNLTDIIGFIYLCFKLFTNQVQNFSFVFAIL